MMPLKTTEKYADKMKELALSSRVDNILLHIKAAAQSGRRFLKLYCASSIGYYRKFTYNTDDLDDLIDLGYKVEEIEQFERYGFLWLKKRVSETFHSINW